ncbi:hypothetical protein K431DRAFT_128264 [Polychaeton citri CBS 116435]|uniref:Uncharacterized protein n=1 Tax=Polychaeton citri CBS 116435 TaxID=1314669 RepID=A0A9P4UMQ3_9PEZI|nr:hypothetical protein K431DRAFT_128264 [Polychaeton citri CBS 116435]
MKPFCRSLSGLQTLMAWAILHTIHLHVISMSLRPQPYLDNWPRQRTQVPLIWSLSCLSATSSTEMRGHKRT